MNEGKESVPSSVPVDVSSLQGVRDATDSVSLPSQQMYLVQKMKALIWPQLLCPLHSSALLNCLANYIENCTITDIVTSVANKAECIITIASSGSAGGSDWLPNGNAPLHSTNQTGLDPRSPGDQSIDHWSSSNASHHHYIGPYQLGPTLGRGNFAVVKLAKHSQLNVKVAIKIMNKDVVGPTNMTKVKRELEAMKRCCCHPHIVRLYQVVETAGSICMISEYAANGEVFDQIRITRAFSESKARELFWQIVCAIDFCHQSGVVHRDLKAENLLLDSDFNIKVGDFGFCNFFRPNQLLSTHCGSPQYAAPELFKGEPYDGPLADVWSLGVILYILVCGSFPFPGESLGDIRNQVLRGLVRFPFYLSSSCELVIRNMLQVDPTRRSKLRQVTSTDWMQESPNVDHYHSLLTVYEQKAKERQFDEVVQRRFPQRAMQAGGKSDRGGGGTSELNDHRLLDQGVVRALALALLVDEHKLRSSILAEKFDQHYAAYQLLTSKIDRFKSNPPLCDALLVSSKRNVGDLSGDLATTTKECVTLVTNPACVQSDGDDRGTSQMLIDLASSSGTVDPEMSEGPISTDSSVGGNSVPGFNNVKSSKSVPSSSRSTDLQTALLVLEADEDAILAQLTNCLEQCQLTSQHDKSDSNRRHTVQLTASPVPPLPDQTGTDLPQNDDPERSSRQSRFNLARQQTQPKSFQGQELPRVQLSMRGIVGGDELLAEGVGPFQHPFPCDDRRFNVGPIFHSHSRSNLRREESFDDSPDLPKDQSIVGVDKIELPDDNDDDMTMFCCSSNRRESNTTNVNQTDCYTDVVGSSSKRLTICHLTTRSSTTSPNLSPHRPVGTTYSSPTRGTSSSSKRNYHRESEESAAAKESSPQSVDLSLTTRMSIDDDADADVQMMASQDGAINFLPQLNLPAAAANASCSDQPVGWFTIKDPHLLAPPEFMTPQSSSFPRRSSDGAAELQPLHRPTITVGGSNPENSTYRSRTPTAGSGTDQPLIESTHPRSINTAATSSDVTMLDLSQQQSQFESSQAPTIGKFRPTQIAIHRPLGLPARHRRPSSPKSRHHQSSASYWSRRVSTNPLLLTTHPSTVGGTGTRNLKRLSLPQPVEMTCGDGGQGPPEPSHQMTVGHSSESKPQQCCSCTAPLDHDLLHNLAQLMRHQPCLWQQVLAHSLPVELEEGEHGVNRSEAKAEQSTVDQESLGRESLFPIDLSVKSKDNSPVVQPADSIRPQVFSDCVLQESQQIRFQSVACKVTDTSISKTGHFPIAPHPHPSLLVTSTPTNQSGEASKQSSSFTVGDPSTSSTDSSPAIPSQLTTRPSKIKRFLGGVIEFSEQHKQIYHDLLPKISALSRKAASAVTGVIHHHVDSGLSGTSDTLLLPLHPSADHRSISPTASTHQQHKSPHSSNSSLLLADEDDELAELHDQFDLDAVGYRPSWASSFAGSTDFYSPSDLTSSLASASTDPEQAAASLYRFLPSNEDDDLAAIERVNRRLALARRRRDDLEESGQSHG